MLTATSGSPEDPRGQKLAEEIDESKLMVLNEDCPTRVVKETKCSPDISLASNSLAMNIEWTTESALGSDHIPIGLTLESEITLIEAPKRTFINFKKADWPSFREELEFTLAKTSFKSAAKGEETFRKLVTKAASRHIPQGRIKSVIPNFPTEAIKLTKERRATRTSTRGP